MPLLLVLPCQLDSSSLPPPESPSRNDGVTIACARCGRPVPPAGRRRFCSDACRQAAFRQRHRTSATIIAVLARTQPTSRATTVYECPAGGTRFLGEQRCVECNVFCRRIGPGGACPHCEEPVAIADLCASPTLPSPGEPDATPLSSPVARHGA